MSINDMDDIFNNSSQMSFLGSSPYTKKYDTSIPPNPTVNVESIENSCGNASIEEVDDPVLEVEEIDEECIKKESSHHNSPKSQDHVNIEVSGSNSPTAPPSNMPPRDYEMYQSTDSKSRYSWRKVYFSFS